MVKVFQFEGHHLLSTEALNASVSGFVGRSLGFEDLRTVRDAVEQAYRDAGWLAQVNLPRQDVTSGIVTFKVVEATFAGVRFEGEPPQRVSKQRIEALFAEHIKTGEAARLDLIDRALLLSDDLPGVTVAGALEADQRDGETALLLKSSDEAVGLPKGSATVGAGFSFDLPPAVREIITGGTRVEPTTLQGGHCRIGCVTTSRPCAFLRPQYLIGPSQSNCRYRWTRKAF